MGLVKSTIELNIGLGNNPMNFDQVVRHFGINPEFGIFHFAHKTGEYNGEQEDTVYLKGNTTLIYSYLIARIEQLCKLLTQECIAVKLNGQGILVYDTDYQGELKAFNEEYWVQ